MSRWLPSPSEERWLEVASELGAALPREALADRAGGWRSTGPLARIALFVLGVVAAALLLGVVGFADAAMLLVAGAVATLAAEWLTLRQRLFASGIEEGLTVAGFLMIGLWIAIETVEGSSRGESQLQVLVVIVAVGAAGLRRLNAVVTTCAAVALAVWAGMTGPAHALEDTIGANVTSFALGCAFAAAALILGSREFRRPSHDRILDWLVAVPPVAVYALDAKWRVLERLELPSGSHATRVAIVALLLPLAVALLATGLRRRQHAPLWGFLGCVAALAVELRASIPVAMETWLIACGLAALAAGLALERYLREPRAGLTSASLTKGEGPLDLLQVAGTALLAHRATPEVPSAEPGFEGGGGKFGGGGASGRY